MAFQTLDLIIHAEQTSRQAESFFKRQCILVNTKAWFCFYHNFHARQSSTSLSSLKMFFLFAVWNQAQIYFIWSYFKNNSWENLLTDLYWDIVLFIRSLNHVTKLKTDQFKSKAFVDDSLTYSHTMTPFDAPGKQAFRKQCGKRRNCS